MNHPQRDRSLSLFGDEPYDESHPKEYNGLSVKVTFPMYLRLGSDFQLKTRDYSIKK